MKETISKLLRSNCFEDIEIGLTLLLETDPKLDEFVQFVTKCYTGMANYRIDSKNKTYIINNKYFLNVHSNKLWLISPYSGNSAYFTGIIEHLNLKE